MNSNYDIEQLEHETSELRKHNLATFLNQKVDFCLEDIQLKIKRTLNFFDYIMLSSNYDDYFYVEFERCFTKLHHIDILHKKVEINFYEAVEDKYIQYKINIHHIPEMDIKFTWDENTGYVFLSYKHYTNLTPSRLIDVFGREFKNDFLLYMKNNEMK